MFFPIFIIAARTRNRCLSVVLMIMIVFKMKGYFTQWSMLCEACSFIERNLTRDLFIQKRSKSMQWKKKGMVEKRKREYSRIVYFGIECSGHDCSIILSKQFCEIRRLCIDKQHMIFKTTLKEGYLCSSIIFSCYHFRFFS